MPETLHGLIQKARNEASTYRYDVKEASDGWRLWVWETGWIYVGKFTRRRDIDTFIVAQLSQEDR